jgi:hypothetical protein
MMKARRTLAPGGPGTKNETAKYGKRLVCVRYRIDTETSRRYKTVELIEEEITLPLKARPIPVNKIMKIRILPHETHIRHLVKSVGGKWDFEDRVWLLPYREIKSLGLESRIVLHKK